jgi:hypothetical protein
MTIVALRSAQAGAILTALGLSAGLMTGVAQAEPPPGIPREHSCPSPFFPNSDLNVRYGVSERIVGPPGCRVAFAGEKWVRAVPPWITAPNAADAGYPAGYDPCANGGKPGETCSLNPIDDFNLKFQGARYVIDAGTQQERTINAGKEILRTGFAVPQGFVEPPGYPANIDGFPFSSPVSPVFRPLSVGNHTINVFVTMSAQHCNGIKPAPTPALGLGPAGAACLPAGESRYPATDLNGGTPDVGLAFTVASQPPPSPSGG